MNTSKRRIPYGRVALTLIGFAAPVGAFTADWNETHVFNPRWSPHAKFHNAQTLSLAVMTAALTGWQAWTGPPDLENLRSTAVFSGLTWATMVAAPFFPGTAVVDPDSPTQPFRKFGVPINQVTGAVVVLVLVGVAYWADARTLRAVG